MQTDSILNIERAVLSTIIFDPKRVYELESLKIDDFYHPFHQHLYKAILELNEQDKPIDEEFIKEELEKSNSFDEVAFLDVISSTPVSILSVYIEEIKEHSKTRQIENILLNIKKQIADRQNSIIILDSLKQQIEKIEQQQEVDTYPKIDIIDTIFQEPENLDFILKGFEVGTIGILTGQGNTGKGFLSLMLISAFSTSSILSADAIPFCIL